MFTKTFKYYKSKQKPPDLKDVIDFDETLRIPHQIVNITSNPYADNIIYSGLHPPSTWKVFTLPSNPGLIFIRNPFTEKGQRYWIAKCLRDYPKSPHEVNLKNIKWIPSEALTDWWQTMQKTSDKQERLKLKHAMRWATLGYHHNWDTKVYSEKVKNEFPNDLGELTKHFARILNLTENYSAEAAIVNFYPIGTTLAGHTDHSEKDLEAPLFSLSFGQTAIFLIGGETKDVVPTALFLKSGDIVIMSKESRLCYHAVPKILRSINRPWTFQEVSDIVACKKRKLETNGNDNEYLVEKDLWDSIDNGEFWNNFEEYIQDCRININIRQVLKHGEMSL